jgi:flagellar motor switch protein FliN/FliY
MPEELSQEDIDALLAGGGDDGGGDLGGDLGALLGAAEPMDLPDFSSDGGFSEFSGEAASIDMLYDVDLDVKIELGRTHMTVEDVLRVREGSVVQLDKDAGAPVDILINGRLVAFGEVLVLNDYFCVRVTEILSNRERSILKR